MRKYLLFFLFVFVNSNCFAQIQSDSIFVAKSFWGYKFYQHDTRVNINTLANLMVDNREAYDMALRAKRTQTFSAVLGGIGGFLIGIQAGVLVVGGDPNWTIAGIGAGMVVVAIPLSSKTNSQSLKSVDLFNEGLGDTARYPEFKIGVMPSGVGLMIEF